MSTASARPVRAEASIRESIHIPLNATAQMRGVTVAQLCYSFTCDAARLAATGLGHLLPRKPTTRAARGKGGRYKQVKWSQNPAQASEWAELIEGAGSSVAAVIAEAALAYITSGGDPLTMAWPPTMARPTAAA